MPNGGMEIIKPNDGVEPDGQVTLPVGADIHTNPLDAKLAGALLGFVRDTEAGLDVTAKRLKCDAHTLPRDDTDGLAELTVETAFAAGQRDTLERVIEVIATVVKDQTVEKPEKEE